MKSRILTATEVRIAQRICEALAGEKTGDALMAMNSVMAATINDRAKSHDEARADASWYAELLETTVRAGLSGRLIRSDEGPIDMRFIV
ncbi:MAG: hypothetical protein M9955_13330 [Rhizobiaceae bacterium]|nr:hypothetical protein [Rhizobiaceae bacterium]